MTMRIPCIEILALFALSVVGKSSVFRIRPKGVQDGQAESIARSYKVANLIYSDFIRNLEKYLAEIERAVFAVCYHKYLHRVQPTNLTYRTS